MDLDKPDWESEIAGDLHIALCVATGLVMRGSSVEEFLDWAKSAIPHLAPVAFEGLDPENHQQVAFWLGVNLWNAAPLPANHYKPAPLPKPQRNAPCPCGSTRKYKQCCAGQPSLEPLPGDIYWYFIPEVCSKRHIGEMVATGDLPVEGIAIMAHQFFEAEDYAQVIKMLDSLFAGEAKRVGRQHEGLLSLLCDAYNRHYKTDRKKLNLLQRMCKHRDMVIRSEAWQRMATWQQDQGNFQAAHEALSQAMRADPDNPSHALLELILLVSAGELDRARQRATFWHARLKRYQHELPELLDTINLARKNPVQALQIQMRLASEDDDDRLERLLAWLDTTQALPRYRIEAIGPPESTAGSEYPATIDMFGDIGADEEHFPNEPLDDELDFEDPLENAAILLPPDDVAGLEAHWHEIRPLDKPFSVYFEPMDHQDIWNDPLDDEWLDFLEQHPEAINSLDVLDDIITLIYVHPLGETSFGPMHDCHPALQRARRIIEQIPLPADKTLPWLIPENRPALRLLAHQILVNEHLLEDQTQARKLIEQYLRLNPTDNHGYRAQLVNNHLRQGLNEQAAAICGNYPHDMLPEIRYGHVLALYRLGDLVGAARLLVKAVDDLPMVKDYLVKKRVAKPRLDPEGVRLGGRDQAWIYREDMRDCWVETTGCLDWLKAQ